MSAALWTGRRAEPATVAADVAATVRKELGLAAAPAAMTLPGNSTGVPAGSLLPPRERFSGMPAPTDCFVYLDAQQPRPFELRAAVMSGRTAVRRALGLGALVYAVPLRLPNPVRASLSAPGGRGLAPFEGDPAVADRLNADAGLLEAANRLSSTRAGQTKTLPSGTARQSWDVDRLLMITPGADSAVLVVRTLHRVVSSGWQLRADTVLDFAARLETTLCGVRG
ncbi:hypothetical protein [Amycolatopsis sp. cg13]|uniref:hypothetical protein n=1 Tax=Amycolatopsis sp. cg13 TaxID=3238807 RepID=UPI0035234859